VSIHDVHMNDTTAAFACGVYLLTKAGKISRKNRRCQFDQTWSLNLVCEIQSGAASKNSTR